MLDAIENPCPSLSGLSDFLSANIPFALELLLPVFTSLNALVGFHDVLHYQLCFSSTKAWDWFMQLKQQLKGIQCVTYPGGNHLQLIRNCSVQGM